MNRVHQPRPLVVLGLNVGMGTAAGADELVEIPYIRNRLTRTNTHPLLLQVLWVWSYWSFDEQSTSATPVDCPWTQRLDGHRCGSR